MSLAVRTGGDPMKLAPAIRSLIRSVDRDQPIVDMMTLEQRLGNVLAPRRLTMFLGTSLGALALCLAAVGIYGLLSFSAVQRTHEIGVRMALGARKGDVLKMILGEGLKLALAGTVLGVLAACALTRFLASQLYGISPLDPGTFVIVSLLLPVIALASSYQPARQATQVDPISALRSE
jgi:putative ABC transport system permease protein